jgi:polyadenylation factor subunit 2
VKCIEWHPTNSVIASGGKDNLVKLWDARTAAPIATVLQVIECSALFDSASQLHGHRNTVLNVRWHDNGRLLLTGARDQMLKYVSVYTCDVSA